MPAARRQMLNKSTHVLRLSLPVSPALRPSPLRATDGIIPGFNGGHIHVIIAVFAEGEHVKKLLQLGIVAERRPGHAKNVVLHGVRLGVKVDGDVGRQGAEEPTAKQFQKKVGAATGVSLRTEVRGTTAVLTALKQMHAFFPRSVPHLFPASSVGSSGCG